MSISKALVALAMVFSVAGGSLGCHREKGTMEKAGETPTNASVAAAIQKECGRGSVSTVIRAFRDKPAKKTNR